MMPQYGRSSSEMRKVALATTNEQTSSAATTVALGGANKPNAARMSVNQETITTKKGPEIELPW